MNRTLHHAPVGAPLQEPAEPVIPGGGLQESRQRWRHLVGLASDLAFETDAKGCFVFLMPETILGWSARALIGQPSELLIGDEGTGAAPNPFRPIAELRGHRAWVRCFNGSLALVTVAASPLYDATGRIVGARGVCMDTSSGDTQSPKTAGRLRRGDTLDHILSRVGQEKTPDGMLDAALWALIHALGAEGSAVIGATSETAPIEVLHECGPGASAVVEAAGRLLTASTPQSGPATNLDGRIVIAVSCQTRFGANAGLAVWRKAGSRQWDQDDIALAGSAVSIVRMILEYEAQQQEMAYQARSDALTGLLNGRAFLQDVERQVARLDRESEGGTLMFADLDAFKSVNDRLGPATGDDLLVTFADMLRKSVRPSDVLARLGGDEFAIWLSGADHMTAAERADHLCKATPAELQSALPEEFPGLGVSIGLATRQAGSHESIEALMKRADQAMYQVKRDGRGHWRVSLQDAD